jgi:succinate dehydrogenase hydrophobic anchor subunit
MEEEHEYTCFNEEYLRFAQDIKTPWTQAFVAVLTLFSLAFISVGLTGIIMDIHPGGVFTSLFSVGVVMFLTMLFVGSIFLIGYCTLPKPNPRRRRVLSNHLTWP